MIGSSILGSLVFLNILFIVFCCIICFNQNFIDIRTQQLIDSTRKAYGVIEDVIDRIKNFYFLADFLVVDVKLRKELRKGSIILDRPLVTIVKVVISLGRRS